MKNKNKVIQELQKRAFQIPMQRSRVRVVRLSDVIHLIRQLE